MRPERQLLCFLDVIETSRLEGWAVDFERPAESLKLRVMIDDAIEDVILCDGHRDDARLVNQANSRIGFTYDIPERYWDGVRHRMRFVTLDGALLPVSTRAGGAVEEYSFVLSKPVRLMATVDGMVDGLIQGWALRVDDAAGTKLGGVRVLVTHEGQPIAELLADQFRGDVAQAVGGDAACGFAFAPPPALRRREQVSLKFFALPEREELTGSPLEISFPGDNAREKIEQLIQRTDELFSFAYHLKKELKAAIPRERYLLADYPRWALESRPLALPRARATYGVRDVSGVKVSVICPVYRLSLIHISEPTRPY